MALPSQIDIDNSLKYWRAFDALWSSMKTSDQHYQYRKIKRAAQAGKITWKEAAALAEQQAENLNRPFWEDEE